jgi:beta-mannosidase
MTSMPVPPPAVRWQPPSVALTGPWTAAPADEALRREYPNADFDDQGWEPLTVPGHWSSTPAFADEAGPVLHRHRFETPDPFGPGHGEPDAPGDDRRTWLVLDGVFYTSDVWLDGNYVGDTEGYFFPHAFEVTGALAARRDHTLAVEVACRPDGDPRSRRTLLGAFGSPTDTDDDPRPSIGGLWRPVRLEQSGPVRISRLRVRCTEVTDEIATVAVRAVLDSTVSSTVELHTTVAPAGTGDVEVDDRRSRPLARGENRVEWTVTVPAPRRWWPRALGDQPLYDLRVAVKVPPAAADPGAPGDPVALSDERWRRLGLRTVTARDWVFRVNGERLFLKGAAQGPSRRAMAEATPEVLAGDVGLAAAAGLDFLRLRAHVSGPELYDAADDAGLLLWQDMPVQGHLHRGVRREARRQARELVDLLAHHPSVFLWCAHDEPEPLDTARRRAPRWGTRNRLAARTVAAHALPSWNRTILDRSVRSVLAASDGSRPVVAHAGVLPHPPTLSGTDSHLSFGWYHHEERDLEAAIRLWPRLARFVGSFGAASVPAGTPLPDTGRWPDLAGLNAGAGLRGLNAGAGAAIPGLAANLAVFSRVVPPADFGSFEDWQRATEAYQAALVRHHIETLRRIKYRPCGGFALSDFADGGPAVSAAVLDHDRKPKAAYGALVDACAPVLVVADRPPATVRPGQALALDVHVINDRRIALDDMMLSAYLRWKESAAATPPPEKGSTTTSHRWRWRGDVPPDDCIRIGTVQAVAPDDPGPLIFDLRLSRASDPDTVVAANRYRSLVVPGGDPPGRRPT